jgi:hypothetical protein
MLFIINSYFYIYNVNIIKSQTIIIFSCFFKYLNFYLRKYKLPFF